MNLRLEHISKYIDDGLGFADVGTDHGYLPIEILKRGYKGYVHASDINIEPLEKAIKNAREAGFENRISFSLCDGLDSCPPEAIDHIIIAGMGGDTICSILDKAEWCMDSRYKLILQPMTKAEILRYWLVYNGFEILNDDLVEDNSTLYQVIVARFNGVTLLNDAELFAGKKELSNNMELYSENIESLIKRFRKAISGMKDSRCQELEPKINLMKEILYQLERMR